MKHVALQMYVMSMSTGLFLNISVSLEFVLTFNLEGYFLFIIK